MLEMNNKFFGEKLRLARTFNGFSLSVLGEEIGVSRQYLNRLEVDPKSAPSEELINALSEILHVRSDFFYAPMHGEVREDSCRFRKLKTTPKYLRDRAVSYGTIFNSILSFLENEFELPSINIPDHSVKNRTDIERAAEKCRIDWGLLLNAPINNMVQVLEQFGVVTTVFEEVSDKIDAFSYRNIRPVVVKNSGKGSTSRSRFDLAHELGHLVLHQGVEEDYPYIETEANQFASSFLLPRGSFFREFPKNRRINWKELVQMKIRWRVSLQAIIRRAYDLNLINAVQYRNANIYISRKGWKTSEPNEENIPIEHPEIVPECFKMLKDSGITSDIVARKLKISLFILEKFGLHKFTFDSPQTYNNKIVSLESVKEKRLK